MRSLPWTAALKASRRSGATRRLGGLGTVECGVTDRMVDLRVEGDKIRELVRLIALRGMRGGFIDVGARVEGGASIDLVVFVDGQ